MPGRLVMDVQTPSEPKILKRDGSHLSQTSDGPEPKRVASGLEHDRSRINGIKNESPAPAGHAGIVQYSDSHDDESRRIPELEQYRETLVPLGKMLSRMAQQTYFDLTEVIEQLSDMRVTQSMTNGISAQPGPDKSAVSVDKKLKLMEFAQKHKDRFIKALVLTDWARNMDDTAQLIDVSMFLRKQDWATNAAADSIYRMRDNMTGAQMPNPNLEGALELLATSDAAWMPDLNYIPPQPLTSQEVLATLHDMNFALGVRLALQDDLPEAFREYTIANGRATFRVAGAYEVDIAIADESPESPFYFIDIRLLFTPTPDLSHDRLRTHLEGHVNALLAADGLYACYSFFNNFVLSHKLSILRTQALELARGRYIDHLSVTQVHRSLIIQYWTGQPGGKNWIELGVTRGTRISASVKPVGKTTQRPQISCRWFRRGHEVEHDLEFDFDDLSAESIVRSVIDKHISGRLMSVSNSSAGDGSTNDLRQTIVDDGSGETRHALKISMRGLASHIELTVNPVTGSFIVCATDPATAEDLQRRLDSAQTGEVGRLLRTRFCRLLSKEVQQLASLVGLKHIDIQSSNISRQAFDTEPLAFCVLQRSMTASAGLANQSLALTMTIDLVHGMRWYLSRIRNVDAHMHLGSALLLQYQVEGIINADAIIALEQQMLRKEEHRQLLQEARLAKMPLYRANRGTDSTAYVLKIKDWLSGPGDTLSSSKPVLLDYATISYAAATTSDNAWSLRYTIRTSLDRRLSDRTLKDLIKACKNHPSMQIRHDRSVVAPLNVLIGEALFPRVRQTLLDLVRLVSRIETARGNHFGIDMSSPSSMTLCYAPSLLCTIGTSADDGRPTLHLTTTTPLTVTNPHVRIKDHLERLCLPELTPARFATLCAVLRFTRPLLESLTDLTSRSTTPVGSMLATFHTSTMCKLAYLPPLAPHLRFNLSAQRRQSKSLSGGGGGGGGGKLTWLLKVTEAKGLDDGQKASVAAFLRETGPGWKGLRTAACADASGVSALLERIDLLVGTIRGAAGSSSSAPALPMGGDDAAAAATTTTTTTAAKSGVGMSNGNSNAVARGNVLQGKNRLQRTSSNAGAGTGRTEVVVLD